MSDRDERVDTELDQADLTKREGPGDRAARPSAPPATKPIVEEPVRLDRGTAIGRYIVIDVLGEGGMGVVYSAYDPELDRKVAIKLLQARPGDDPRLSPSRSGTGSTDQQWLQREAQAMARLQHPNVITVHDVGTLPGHRVFVAMEQVDGVTLRVWLRDKTRTWREIIPVMVAAGQGLAAAHSSGLVHRDFKPDNVLVANDGRVRVMDFGLARLRPDDMITPPELSSDSVDSRSPLSTPLTMAGTVIGTPAYMAPEIGDGVIADARSDQFSFGVALYEALYRARPFSKGQPRTKPKTPPDSKVPERVQRVVMRAIAADPAARYRSMDELLEELSKAAAPRRRALMAGAAIVGLAGAAVAGFTISKTTGESAAVGAENQLCKGSERRLADVWDAKQREHVAKAFAATNKPFQQKSFESLARVLDAYTKEWTGAVTDACEATRIRGEQTEDVLSLRQACLDQRVEEVGALVRLLGTADAAMVEQGDRLAYKLEPLKRCSNIAALRAPGLPPTEPKDKVEELRKLLASSKAELIAGRHFGSMEAARKAATLAAEVKYEPYRAEALLVRGASLAGIGNTTEANKVFTDAAWAALSANRHDLVTMGAMSNAAVVSEGRVGEAKIWIGLARTAAARVGNDAALEQRLLQIEGLIAAAQGDTKNAVAAQQKALAIAERALGATNPALWSDVEVIGVTLAKSGAWGKARPYLERALALREQSVGGDHPDIAAILTNLGACYANVDTAEKARVTYEKALAIRERADGPRNPMLILTLNNMADAMSKAKDHANALHYVERGRLLAEQMLGKSAPMYHAIATTHAEALYAAGRGADARKLYDETIALEAEHKSPYLPATLASRAELSIDAKKWNEVVDLESRSIAAFEAASGKDAPDLWKPLVGLAKAKIALNRPDDARALLVRAIAIGERAQVPSEQLDPARKLLDGLKK